MKMQSFRVRLTKVAMATAVGGSSFVLSGCDPEVRSTVLGGLEASTQGLTSSLISALFLTFQEDDAAATGGTGLTTTAP